MNLISADPSEHGDITLTTEEIERFDWRVLRRLAAESECEEIDYRSTRFEVNAYFGRQRTMSDYE